MEEEVKDSGKNRAEDAAGAEAARFSSRDAREILERRGWLGETLEEEAGAELNAWLDRAAMLLGAQSESVEMLEELLGLVFQYDAAQMVKGRESQDVLMREGAREVIRELANRVLDDCGDFDSDRFKEIVEELKRATPYRSRELFQPIRVALAGRAGDGELDRVILLLDAGARVGFGVQVKGVRQRMIEFCAAFE